MSARRLGLIAATAVTILLVAGTAGTAAATKSTITIDNHDGAYETFTTTGGALCPSGTATTDFHRQGGSNVAGTFHLNKTLVCDDNTGSFTIRVDAAVVFGSPTDQGGWSVESGTGAYARMHGGGSLVGTYYGTFGIVDVYTGNVTKK